MKRPAFASRHWVWSPVQRALPLKPGSLCNQWLFPKAQVLQVLSHQLKYCLTGGHTWKSVFWSGILNIRVEIRSLRLASQIHHFLPFHSHHLAYKWAVRGKWDDVEKSVHSGILMCWHLHPFIIHLFLLMQNRWGTYSDLIQTIQTTPFCCIIHMYLVHVLYFLFFSWGPSPQKSLLIYKVLIC